MAIEGRPPSEWPSFDRLCGNRVDTAESSETDVRLRRQGRPPPTLDGTFSIGSRSAAVNRILTWPCFRSDGAKLGHCGMSARGLYRTKTPEGGAEYARVVYGIASPPGEIPKPLYEARGYEPPFDSLPTREEHEARARNSEDADGGDEVVTVSLSAEAYTAVANRTPDPSEVDDLGGYPISLPRALLSRLLRLREPNDRNFSDVIERLAKGSAGEGPGARLRIRA
jgi:hypothetical protein